MASCISRRHALALAAAVGSGGFAGCLTTASTLRAPEIRDSTVFKRITASESWSTNQIPASVSLSTAATTQHGVRGLVITDASGDDYWTGPVTAGQTSASVFFPTSGPATLSAIDYQDRFVDQLRVRISTTSLVE